MLFYFDVNDGRTRSFDEEGLEFEDLAQAQSAAARGLAEIIRDEMTGGERQSYVLTVRDAQGVPV